MSNSGRSAQSDHGENSSYEDFSYVRHKRRQSVHTESGEAEGEGEINIVPYLDIMINLIMFMLVAQATVVSLGND